VCPRCGEQFEWHETRLDRWTPLVGLRMAARSLAIRSLVGLITAPWLIYASVYMSTLINSRRMQHAAGIFLGSIFGYLFARGFSDRAGFASVVLYLLLVIAAAVVVLVASFATHEMSGQLVARAGEKQFWFAAGAFSVSAVMCGLIALWHESE